MRNQMRGTKTSVFRAGVGMPALANYVTGGIAVTMPVRGIRSVSMSDVSAGVIPAGAGAATTAPMSFITDTTPGNTRFTFRAFYVQTDGTVDEIPNGTVIAAKTVDITVTHDN